jgi:hypothetical protein
MLFAKLLSAEGKIKNDTLNFVKQNYIVRILSYIRKYPTKASIGQALIKYIEQKITAEIIIANPTCLTAVLNVPTNIEKLGKEVLGYFGDDFTQLITRYVENQKKELVKLEKEQASLSLQISKDAQVKIKQPTSEQRADILSTKLDPFLFQILSDTEVIKSLSTASDTKTNHLFFFRLIYIRRDLENQDEGTRSRIMGLRQQLQDIYPEVPLEKHPLYQIIKLVEEIRIMDQSLKTTQTAVLNGRAYNTEQAAAYFADILKDNYIPERSMITKELQEELLITLLKQNNDIVFTMNLIDYFLQELVTPKNKEEKIPKGNVTPNVLLAGLKHLCSKSFIVDLVRACNQSNDMQKYDVQLHLYFILRELRALFDSIASLHPKVPKPILGASINIFKTFLDILLWKINDQRIPASKIYNTLCDKGTITYFYMFKQSPAKDSLVDYEKNWTDLLSYYKLSYTQRMQLFADDVDDKKTPPDHDEIAELEQV